MYMYLFRTDLYMCIHLVESATLRSKELNAWVQAGDIQLPTPRSDSGRSGMPVRVLHSSPDYV